jgi:hypothetical protein
MNEKINVTLQMTLYEAVRTDTIDFKTLFDHSSLIMKFGLRPQSSRRGTAGVGSCSGSWIWVQSQHLKFAKHPKREREREPENI